jgi:hypothetical protein
MNPKVKKCNKCNQLLEVNSFSKHSTTKDKLKNSCKECNKKYIQNYLSKNDNYIVQKEKNKVRNKNKYYSDVDYKIQQNKNNKLFFEQNPDYWKEYREKNREKINEYQRGRKEQTNQYRKQKRKNDIEFKLKENIRSYVYQSLNQKNIFSFSTYLGCSIEDYRLYLESQFDENMSWSNYGVYWEIDHISPLHSFNLTIPSEIQKAFNYKNTQPLTIHENRSKSKHI